MIQILILSIASFVLFIYTIYWMVKMLTLTKQSRIIHSMTLKTILVLCESKNIKVDIQKIQQEVEKNVS
jgi:hypothetical protein